MASAAPARVALVGAGSIAARYVEGLRATPGFSVTAICSQGGASATQFAHEHGLTAMTVAAMLADPAIDYVVNLTPAHAHEAVTRSCLDAGKSVYSEKPLATSLAAADALIALAARRGLLLACAPATFLWPPLATARRIVEQGMLGRIVGALTTLVYPGPELFHPHPAHLYAASAGPLHDMGVYQVAALIALLGPVTSVTAMASRARAEREMRVGPNAGQRFPVEAPTHCHALLKHEGGTISSLIVSFDATSPDPPVMLLYGQQGGLSLSRHHAPDADLSVSIWPNAAERMPLDGGEWTPAMFAIGITLAWSAHRAGHSVAASAERARATLATLLAIETATIEGRMVQLG